MFITFIGREKTEAGRCYSNFYSHPFDRLQETPETLLQHVYSLQRVPQQCHRLHGPKIRRKLNKPILYNSKHY